MGWRKITPLANIAIWWGCQAGLHPVCSFNEAENVSVYGKCNWLFDSRSYLFVLGCKFAVNCFVCTTAPMCHSILEFGLLRPQLGKHSGPGGCAHTGPWPDASSPCRCKCGTWDVSCDRSFYIFPCWLSTSVRDGTKHLPCGTLLRLSLPPSRVIQLGL